MSEKLIGPLLVNEYRHTEDIIEWDSISECARAHGVKPHTIKRLIFYGGSLDGHTTFDIPMHCGFDIRETGAGDLEIFDTATGIVLDGGTATKRRMKGEFEHAGENISRLRPSSKREQKAYGNQPRAQEREVASRGASDTDMQAFG